MPPPPFAQGRGWRRRLSKARPQIAHRVWYDPHDDYEYERDPTPLKRRWHQIDWRRREYRDVDPQTGLPVAGREGQWRPLQ